ncbi:MAG TPA: archaellin/type IV pilin N-terminal domain-containing protein [archaeon]|nr:archaellin/type IV pilin N-terminal domain-containing protein [archaeon]
MKGTKKGIAEIVGVIMILMITLSLAAFTYSYITTVYAQRTRPVEVVDSYCEGGKITFVIRNGGTVDLNANAMNCYAVSQSCTSSCSLPANTPPGGAGQITATGCASGRAHTWRLVGPSNVIELYAYCS